MQRKLNIELIKTVSTQDSEIGVRKGLLHILSIIVLPLVFLFSVLFMLFIFISSLFASQFASKSDKQLYKNQDEQFEKLKNSWTILTTINGLEIYKQYVGEIRFGPCYLNLKSKPQIFDLKKRIFGDWFCHYQNGLLIQEWNSTVTPDTNLIFIDSEKFELTIIKKNIPSVQWTTMELTDKSLELKCDTGKEILTYKIDNAL